MSKAYPRKTTKKKPPSPSSHKYHYSIESDFLKPHKPKCERDDAQLFTKDKQIFLDPIYASKLGMKTCKFCCARLKKD